MGSVGPIPKTYQASGQMEVVATTSIVLPWLTLLVLGRDGRSRWMMGPVEMPMFAGTKQAKLDLFHRYTYHPAVTLNAMKSRKIYMHVTCET